jgi:hypothetical protein|tara:strand:- start:755 stop:1387 length:633 start_codon:yes stop_codon:yes gene_type:complete
MARFIANKGIRGRLLKQVKRKFSRSLRFQVLAEIERVKAAHIKLFLEHPITVSMIDKSDAANLIPDSIGGDLPAFLGVTGSQTRSNIKDIVNLYKGTTTKFTDARSRVISFKYINLPSTQDMYEATPSPWKEGSSWVRQIERGASGLGRFIPLERGSASSSNNSRTGRGTQAKKNLRSGSKVQASYVTALLNNYYRELSTVVTRLKIEKK